jgi:uncharacterized protein YbjT (DUF2867 family)
MGDTLFINLTRREQMKNDLILVVGASGTVGTELVQLLKQKGQRVRLTTSKPVQAVDQEKVQVDLATGKGLEAAFEGVDKAFLLSPPGYADQFRILSPLIQEAKKRNLKKVVLMTAMGANAVETSPFRRAEIELEKSGLSYNIIRPNWFFQNFNTFWVQGIREQGKILVPGGDAKVSFIDSQDIAAVAAELLTKDFTQRDFDLTGPEAVDHHQVAAEISKVAGRTVTYQDIAPEQLKASLVQAGAPSDYADVLVMIFGFLREGYAAPVTSHVKTILGRQPKSLRNYAETFQQAWK